MKVVGLSMMAAMRANAQSICEPLLKVRVLATGQFIESGQLSSLSITGTNRLELRLENQGSQEIEIGEIKDSFAAREFIGAPLENLPIDYELGSNRLAPGQSTSLSLEWSNARSNEIRHLGIETNDPCVDKANFVVRQHYNPSSIEMPTDFVSSRERKFTYMADLTGDSNPDYIVWRPESGKFDVVELGATRYGVGPIAHFQITTDLSRANGWGDNEEAQIRFGKLAHGKDLLIVNDQRGLFRSYRIRPSGLELVGQTQTRLDAVNGWLNRNRRVPFHFGDFVGDSSGRGDGLIDFVAIRDSGVMEVYKGQTTGSFRWIGSTRSAVTRSSGFFNNEGLVQLADLYGTGKKQLLTLNFFGALSIYEFQESSNQFVLSRTLETGLGTAVFRNPQLPTHHMVGIVAAGNFIPEDFGQKDELFISIPGSYTSTALLLQYNDRLSQIRMAPVSLDTILTVSGSHRRVSEWERYIYENIGHELRSLSGCTGGWPGYGCEGYLYASMAGNTSASLFGTNVTSFGSFFSQFSSNYQFWNNELKADQGPRRNKRYFRFLVKN